MNHDARDNFRQQAEWCERLGSPFTALVCRSLHEHLTGESAFGARLLDWPGRAEADAIALRACGALSALARRGHSALAPLYPPNPLPSEPEYWAGAPGRALVLVHSIFWQYLPDATRTAIRAAIEHAAARATEASPFAWLRLEAEADERRGARLRLSLWPHGPVDALLALADFHGQWLEWRGSV